MSYVLRTWGCLNRRCGHEFEAGEPNPECPACGCTRVEWRPGGGHVMSAETRHNDRTLRSVADRFGLGDLGQRGGTHEGERAEPHRAAPRALGRYSPMPGFDTAWSTEPTASWASQPYPLRRSFDTAKGAKFGGKRRGIPTTVVAK